jgi:hypothetical protein
MSDAANNALLFEEEIDNRVLYAFINALNDPRREQETGYVVQAIFQHPIMREHITKEIVYRVENTLRQYLQTHYPPEKNQHYLENLRYKTSFRFP